MKFPLLLAAMVAYAYAVPEYKECNPDAKTCEFWLEVKEHLTMMQEFGFPTLIYAKKGTLYRFDEDPNNIKTFVPPSTVITADGVQRMVIAINGTLPGPPLVVYEGQELIIHTTNSLLSDSLTIHWHGMYQYGTNFMDGVGFITMCPTLPGQTFTYKFKAEPKGTHWYHSHVGAQRTNGIVGALIVKERPKPGKVYPKEYIMTVGEWEHESSETSHTKMTQGNFDDEGRRIWFTKALDGGAFSGIPWVSGLIDGKGRYTNPHTGKSTETPLTQYDVKHGEEYRFRVIHTGAQYPVRISVDHHDLVVIATDGHEMQPHRVESFILNAGERFDFILKANQRTRNYWIRAVSVEVNVPNHSVEAILHYEGAPAGDPRTLRRRCRRYRKCKVLNCLWNTYPRREHIQCILMGNVNGNGHSPAPVWEAGSEEHFLNFVIPFTRAGLKSIVNGKIFDIPTVASASQDSEIDPAKDCSRNDCGKNKLCVCNHELKVPYGKTIQMVWLNMGAGAHGSHPIHLHGHSFHLLKTVFAEQNPVTGERVKATELVHPDIDCGGDQYCSQPKWSNAAWNNGNVPGLNLKNPTRRDTVIVPNGGYVVLRIKADNPGKWFMHCHIEVHAIDGMAVVLAEGMDHLKPPPKGFPLCNNFYADPEKDVFRSNKKGNSCQRRDTAADILKNIFL